MLNFGGGLKLNKKIIIHNSILKKIHKQNICSSKQSYINFFNNNLIIIFVQNVCNCSDIHTSTTSNG